MANLTKQYTFSPGVASSSQVNTNFDDIVNFINNEMIQRDGSKAFDQIPLLPASDPTQVNQATRKSYVDTAVSAVATTASAANTAASAAQTTANTAATNATSALSQLPAKLQFTNMTGTSPIGGGTFSGTLLVKAGFNVTGLNGSGDLDITFGTAFPNGIIAVNADLVLGAGTINVLQANSAVWTVLASGFKVRVYRESTGSSITSGNVGVSWTAFGW